MDNVEAFVFERTLRLISEGKILGKHIMDYYKHQIKTHKEYRTEPYFVVKVCYGNCERFKSETVVRPIYENHTRCTKCQVYYEKDTFVCPCCKSNTRSKPRNKLDKEKYINPTLYV